MKSLRLILAALVLFALALPSPAAPARSRYVEMVLADKPVAYWPLKDPTGARVLNLASGTEAAALHGEVEGKVTLHQPAQQQAQFPDFEPDSTGAAFAGTSGNFIRVKDPGANSPLDFAQGNSVTLEAWVFLNAIGEGQQVYLIGKGRTGNAGFDPNNQNWALRLRGQKNQARLSFLFRSAPDQKVNGTGSDRHWHRWTSDASFAPNSGWHHVAITYTFGKGDSLRGYLDGELVTGTWDMGGKSDAAPVVDDDEVWIGSSMGGKAGNFNGLLNEIAIYRTALKAADIKERFRFIPPGPAVAATDLPKNAVRVELVENIPAVDNWNFIAPTPVETYLEPAFAFIEVPHKYSPRGVRIDRSSPFLLRAAAQVYLPAGEHKLLLRSLQSARLFMDGKLLAQTRFIKGSGDGHGPVAEVPAEMPAGLRFARMGHEEAWVTVKSPGGEHLFVLEGIVGGKIAKQNTPLKPELGELSVTRQMADGSFLLLAPQAKIPHTDEGWTAYHEERLARLQKMNAQRRQQNAVAEQNYWKQRHELTRRHLASLPPLAVPKVSPSIPVHNEIDRFIGARLETARRKPATLIDDYSFLRRLSLDTIGLPPTPEQLRTFLNNPDRRAAIDRFLAHPGWADNWVSYWQDVLAENPGILKPTLNNTGPFRWWIHEAFSDNKPMDRFVTELILMEGSVYGGGPAGFGLATQNDVPMADRAQIISSAFLAKNLACARCHDAPYHDFKQQELFSLAAMLNQGPQEVPPSSSIPANANITIGRLVNVTLKPGEKVHPSWPFAKTVSTTPEGTVRDPKNSREQLAAFVTAPQNDRFAKVLVNRLWKRYLGLGLIEPVDDWETAKASHPELLEWLARELMAHNYDLKHVARLILNSHTYQRTAGGPAAVAASDKPEDRLFAAPERRRLSAEQVVDSLFAVVGKSFDTEPLTLDQDSRRPAKDFLNLGTPKRAWEFTGFANDRDRPALSMPKAQAINDVLLMFGWRESRQSAVSVRDDSPNVLQPALLANGDMANARVTRLCDGNDITTLCLQAQPLPQLVESIFLRVLSRPPSDEEAKLLSAHLEHGYAQRVLPGKAKPLHKEYDKSLLLSWSNHLNPMATDIKLEAERKAQAGDEPTDRLRPDWRERMEDSLWALVNSPEFLFIP